MSVSSSRSSKMTYEESQTKVLRLKDAIAQATAMKNYERSAQLQDMLDKHMIIHNKLQQNNDEMEIEEKIADLERIKLEQESDIIQSLMQQMNAIYNNYERDYAELERRHFDTIEQLQNKFNKPKFTSIPLSPNLRALQRAENYYARNKDFRAAAAIKNQIRQVSQREMQEFKQTTTNTIEAKIRDAVHKYQTEQKCFAERLWNERNLLKKETLKVIMGLNNRYKKLLMKRTGRTDYDFQLMTEFKDTVFKSIDNEFQQFAKSLQSHYQAPKLSENDPKEKAEPRPINTEPYRTRGSTSRAPRRYPKVNNKDFLNEDEQRIQTTLNRRNRAFDMSVPLSK